MSASFTIPKLWAAIAIVAFSTVVAWAQIDTGSIVGMVRYPSGAAVPKATVTVTNGATGVSETTQTNSAGEYQVPALIPGTYSVKVNAPGFASQVTPPHEVSPWETLPMMPQTSSYTPTPTG